MPQPLSVRTRLSAPFTPLVENGFQVDADGANLRRRVRFESQAKPTVRRICYGQVAADQLGQRQTLGYLQEGDRVRQPITGLGTQEWQVRPTTMDYLAGSCALPS